MKKINKSTTTNFPDSEGTCFGTTMAQRKKLFQALANQAILVSITHLLWFWSFRGTGNHFEKLSLTEY